MTIKDKIERAIKLEKLLGYGKQDMLNYKDFWGIKDSELLDKWLEKLEMHAFPIKPPSVIFDIQPWDAFVSPATGKVISSKSQRREDMRASGCRDWEGMDSEVKVSKQRKQAVEKQQEAETVEAVSRAWAQLEPDKKKIMLDN